MSLLDPALRDVMVTDLLEAKTRRVMAERVALKRLPGTHGQQAELLAEVDDLLERWNLLVLGR